MKNIYYSIILNLSLLLSIISCSDETVGLQEEHENSQVEEINEGLNYSPETPDADSALTIIFKAGEASALYNYVGDVYIHTGVVEEGVWLYVPGEWTENLEKCKMTAKSDNVWEITLSPSIREWFNSGETAINKLGIVIRSSDGSKKGIEEDSFIEVTDNRYTAFQPAPIIEQTMPSGIVEGINITGGNSVTFAFYDKDKNGNHKDFAYILGDFNNWTLANDGTSQMYRDNSAGCWWITVENLDPAKEYCFQYYTGTKDEGVIRLADAYSEKILDPDNDKYIPESTYPSSEMIYPEKGIGIVSTFKINKDEYSWAYDGYRIENRNSLVIYELLLRDFTETKDLNGAIQKLDYLQNLGVTAIELMPVQEFDGNSSWGYNPCYYFALDKAYGTKQKYKKFIDECHKRNMAVIFDVVYNHATGANPFAKLYWDSENNKTASNNPWFNVDAPHSSSVFHDFNHTEPMVKAFIKRNLEYLMDEYHVDGFRFDLTKGFVQHTNGDEYAYNQERIDILKDYYSTIKSKREDAIMICEHWCGADEEHDLSLAGMMCWNKVCEPYYQAGMGWQDNSDFGGMFWKGNYDATKGGWVSYFESHDEERAAFKAKEWGTDIIKSDIQTRMNSMAALAAFTFTVSGPKMIWQGGELGFDTALLNYSGVGDQEDGKTDEKPIDWVYLDDPARKSLHDAYSAILNFRKEYPQLFDGTASMEQYTNYDSWTGGRTISISTVDGKKMWIVGFFADTAESQYQIVPAGWDTYYNLISGVEEKNIGGNIVNITEGHNFRIYTNFVPDYNN